MNIRQLDLFFREKQPLRSAPPIRSYRKTEKRAPKAFAWESMGAWVRQMNRLFAIEAPSSDHYARVRATARTLTVERIRECRHDDDLARCEAMLVQAKQGWLYGLDRAFTKAERGELLVEVRNRRQLIKLGRSSPKGKGPRLDPSLLPPDALNRLIQSHPDIEVVECLRAERDRREALQNDNGTGTVAAVPIPSIEGSSHEWGT
jgi:hypothetical protein